MTRKRASDTAVVKSDSFDSQHNGHRSSAFDSAARSKGGGITQPTGADTNADTGTNATNNNRKNRPQLRVRIKRWHGVAHWTWNCGEEDEVCGICQSAYEGVAPGAPHTSF